MSCTICRNETDTVSAISDGQLLTSVCRACLLLRTGDSTISSNAQGYDRRRQYEDYAQDTLQPYTASGPNAEFFRVYPEQSQKIFTPAEIEALKRKI